MTRTSAVQTRPPTVSGASFHLLGPVRARLNGVDLDLGGSKPCGVLAMLLLGANRPVSVDALVDGLWIDPPRTAAKMIQIYISRIRQQLGDAGKCLHTASAGYSLQTDPAAFDLTRFQDLSDRARGFADVDPTAAAALLREALALWHGPALANVRGEPFSAAAAARLDELRMGALEARIDADLASGCHRDVVAELQQLVATHPTREHLAAELMLALYRSGRQADALTAAQRLRTDLDEQLGITPCPTISRLEVAILRHDATLDLAPSPPAAPWPPAAPLPLVPAHAAAAGDPPPMTPSRRRRARRWAPVASAILIATSVIAGIAGITGSSSQGTAHKRGRPLGISIKAGSTLVLDGANDSVVADIPVGNRPDFVSVAGDSVWVASTTQRTVTRVDLTSNTVGETFGLPAWPSNLVATGADVWLSEAFLGTVTRVFTAGGRLTAPFYPDGRHAGLVVLSADNGHLYAGLPDGRLVALDTGSLRTAAQTRLRDRVALLARSGSTLCAGFFRAAAVDCMHAPDLAVTRTMLLPNAAVAITSDGNSTWALAGAPAEVWRLDLTGISGPQRINIPPEATGIAASPNYLWILYGRQGRLLRLPVDAARPAVTLDIGRPATALATWRDDVIVAVT